MVDSDSDDKEAGPTSDENTGKKTKLSGDTNRVKILEEIKLLSQIPEIESYFSRALLEARHIFQDKIDEYYDLKDNIKSDLSKNKSEEEAKEEEKTELPQSLSKSKTYFFELTRTENLVNGFQWELGKIKARVDGKTLDMIFNDFKKEIDGCDIAPQRIQEKTVYSSPLDKWFQIKFTKSSQTRVVGFVKETEEPEKKAEKEKEEDKMFVVRSNRNMLKLATAVKPLDPEEVEGFLKEEDREFTRNVTYYMRFHRAVSGFVNVGNKDN